MGGMGKMISEKREMRIMRARRGVRETKDEERDRSGAREGYER